VKNYNYALITGELPSKVKNYKYVKSSLKEIIYYPDTRFESPQTSTNHKFKVRKKQFRLQPIQGIKIRA